MFLFDLKDAVPLAGGRRSVSVCLFVCVRLCPVCDFVVGVCVCVTCFSDLKSAVRVWEVVYPLKVPCAPK